MRTPLYDRSRSSGLMSPTVGSAADRAALLVRPDDDLERMPRRDAAVLAACARPRSRRATRGRRRSCRRPAPSRCASRTGSASARVVAALRAARRCCRPRSMRGSSPARSHQVHGVTAARRCPRRSSATRLTPSANVPPAGRPYTLNSSRLCCRRAASMRTPEPSTLSGRHRAERGGAERGSRDAEEFRRVMVTGRIICAARDAPGDVAARGSNTGREAGGWRLEAGGWSPLPDAPSVTATETDHLSNESGQITCQQQAMSLRQVDPTTTIRSRSRRSRRQRSPQHRVELEAALDAARAER